MHRIFIYLCLFFPFFGERAQPISYPPCVEMSPPFDACSMASSLYLPTLPFRILLKTGLQLCAAALQGLTPCYKLLVPCSAAPAACCEDVIPLS